MKDVYKILVSNKVPNQFMNMQLAKMRCKHVINPVTGSVAWNVEEISRTLCGYNYCLWGTHNHDTSAEYHMEKIKAMERANYNHIVRIVICNYDFDSTPCIWIDNLHSAIKYVREKGTDAKLKNIPFYIVDITHPNQIFLYSYNNSVRNDIEDILGAVACAFKRKRRSNNKLLIEINYTLEDFLKDNNIFLSNKEREKDE